MDSKTDNLSNTCVEALNMVPVFLTITVNKYFLIKIKFVIKI